MPYYDLLNLAVHHDINPAVSPGQELMDSGSIYFTNTTFIDLSRSASFRHSDVYCVAPLTSNGQVLAQYDYWVVGMNCCNGQWQDFHCDRFNDPEARAGLRLMR